MRENYHHGNLPETLIHEAAGLLAERGADGFSMREVARRAGVAVAAPSHHFGNAQGLLTSVAICGFERLAEEFRIAIDDIEDPLERVVALCHTYMGMGVRYPGYAAAMFGRRHIDHENDRFRAAASASFDRFRTAVTQALPSTSAARRAENVTKTLWATMHGFITLSMTGDDEMSARIRFAVKALLDGAHE